MKEYPDHWPLQANPSRQNPAHWNAAGRLNSAGLREIARRFQAGEGPRAIARATGASERNVGYRVRQIAAAMRVPTPAEAVDQGHEDIMSRWGAGENAAQIAAATGRSRDYVTRILRSFGVRVKRRFVFMTPELIAEIERRGRAGEGAERIARDLGYDRAAVYRRLKRLRDAGELGVAKCKCGRFANHKGVCDLPAEQLQTIRTRLKAGIPIAEIAAELGLHHTRVKSRAEGMIKELTAEGVTCVCGRPLGHSGAGAGGCSAFTERRAKFAFDVLAMLEQGMWKSAIARELGCEPATVAKVADPILARWESEGRTCACGRAPGHRGRCTARLGHEGEYRGLKALPMSLGWVARRSVAYRLARGWPIASVVAELSISKTAVTMIADQMTSSGTIAKKCRCGKPMRHPGPCRTEAPVIQPAEVFELRLGKREIASLRRHYRLGTSLGSTARLTQISIATIKRYFSYWAETSQAKVMPCACGRQARHAGGCPALSKFGVTKSVLAKIKEMTLGGRTVAEISDALNLSFKTVLAHGAEARAEAIRRGVSCACGAPVGHRGPCEKTWERGGRVRGARPVPADAMKQIRGALVAGESVARIAQDAALRPNVVARALRQLTESERAARRQMIRKRAGEPTLALSIDEMIAAATALVPKGLERSLRDEVVSALMLKIIEGQVAARDLKAIVKRTVNEMYRAWADQWGPSSLDVGMDDDGGGRTGHDIAGDETAIEQLGEITIGEDPIC